mmetsp:Transcript_7549/g.15736  ORF Transcript_7549/g.15736 Transcript_7549/m.15736 type:complete len:298 (-) Transcript_7549:29-922(-)
MMFVCMKALEFLGQSSGEVEAYGALRKKLVRETVLEAYTLHFLAAALPWGLCIVHTIKSHFQEAEYSMAVLACLVGWAKVVLATTSAATSFIIRLDQKLMILEIERVRQDIRGAFTGDRDLGSVEDVYHLAPRVKKLLVEAHNMCNNTHKFFYLWAPVIFFHMVFLIFGVLNASSGICMPFWIFVAEIQPCMSMIKFIHGYARINLYLERDVKEDVAELGLRLSTSPEASSIPAPIFEMLHHLERMDGRACVLPFDFIPSMEASRSIISNSLTVLFTVGPYLAVLSNLGNEYMCLKR